jgi:hypothetical protein
VPTPFVASIVRVGTVVPTLQHSIESITGNRLFVFN